MDWARVLNDCVMLLPMIKYLMDIQHITYRDTEHFHFIICIIANIESIVLHTGTGCKILQERVIYNKFIEGILTKKIIFLS